MLVKGKRKGVLTQGWITKLDMKVVCRGPWHVSRTHSSRLIVCSAEWWWAPGTDPILEEKAWRNLRKHQRLKFIQVRYLTVGRVAGLAPDNFGIGKLALIGLGQRTNPEVSTIYQRPSFQAPTCDLSISRFFHLLLSISTRHPKPPTWVACTAEERASRSPQSHILATHLHGWRRPRSKWLTRYASSQRREQPHHKSVFFLETRTVLHKSRWSLVGVQQRCSRATLLLCMHLLIYSGNKILRILKSNGTILSTWVMRSSSLVDANDEHSLNHPSTASAWSRTDGVISTNRPRPWDTRGPLHADQKGSHSLYPQPLWHGNNCFHRLSLSASISNATERTRTPNSVWFSSSPASTVFPAITKRLAYYHQPGDMRVPQRVPWSHKRRNLRFKIS